MLECIFSVPSEIDRKGPEKHMEGLAQQAFKLNFFSPLLGLSIHLNSWMLMGLAFFVLAAFFSLLYFLATVWFRQCDVVENHHRLEIAHLGNQGRRVYNDPHQDTSRCNFSYARFSEKCFTYIYSFVWRHLVITLQQLNGAIGLGWL